MTIEIILGCITAGGALVASLTGGSLLSRYVKHSSEQAVTNYRLEQTEKQVKELIEEVKTLKTDSVEIATRVEQFSDSIKKLDLIPELAAKLAAMEDLVTNVRNLCMVLTQAHTIQAS